MKIFANKKIWKRLVIILLFITVFSFVTPQSVQASDDATIGGVLMKPICNLLVGFCDGVVNIIHRFVVNQSKAKITIDLTSGLLEKLWIAVGIALVVALTAAAIIATAGVATILGLIKVRNSCGNNNRTDICVCNVRSKLRDRNDSLSRRRITG